MENAQLGIVALLIVAFAVGAYFYQQMPQNIAVHWGVEGSADGFAQKEFWAFSVPVLMTGIAVLFYIMPKIDPLGKNIGKFKNSYWSFALALVVFLFYLNALAVAWNIGFVFNMGQMLAPAFAFLLYCRGILLGKAEPNWFVGIRTPWTLSSKKVWEKTHRLGGKLFKACAAVAVIGAFVPQYAVAFVIAPVLAIAFFLIAYSYVKYGEQGRKR